MYKLSGSEKGTPAACWLGAHYKKHVYGRGLFLKRGKFGLCLAFYAILAFVLALLKQPVLCGLLLAFVLVTEEEPWVPRQVLQGFMLSLAAYFFMDLLFTFTAVIPIRFGFLLEFFTGAQRMVSLLGYAASAVFCLLGIVRTAKGQEADLPLFSSLAYRAFGQQKPQPVKQQQVFPQAPYGQPVQYPAPAQPMPPAPPVQGGQQAQPPAPPYPAMPSYADPTAPLPQAPVQPEQPQAQPAPQEQQPPQQL